MSKEPKKDSRSRRHFCRDLTVAAVAATAARPDLILADEKKPGHAATPSKYPTNANEALETLIAGNRRFAAGETCHPHESKDWRQSLEAGQHPFAVVLGCADSRVCPELVFDQGLGDLFVVRVAGNIVDVDVTASIEYAVSHLKTKLVIVLGHSNCGAVTATLDQLADSSDEPNEIISLLYRVEPALVGLPKNLPRQELIDLAVKQNVAFSVRRLARVPDLRKSVRKNGLRVVGALYDMHTGLVEVLDR